MRSNSRLVYIN